MDRALSEAIPMIVVHDPAGSALVLRPGLMPSTTIALLGVALEHCHTARDCPGRQSRLT